MTVAEARRRLGLRENDRLAEYLPHWKKAEARLQGLADETGDPVLKAHYLRDLNSLREVLSIVADQPEPKRGGAGLALWLTVVAALGGGGWMGYQQWVVKNEHSLTREVAEVRILEKFDEAIEKRRWDEAERLIGEFADAGIDEEVVVASKARIDQGKLEERGQQIAFLIGVAQSSLEAGQLTEAENYCDQVEEMQPDHPQLEEIRGMIRESRIKVRSLLMVREIEKALKEQNWEVAGRQLESLAKEQPEHAEIPGLRTRLETARKQAMENQAKAADLLAQARKLDQGVYSGEALSLLEEAVRLHPTDEIKELYQRMSEYGKVLRVPSEHATIAAALKEAKANDRIFVENGSYTESLVVPAGVEIVGESREETIIEYPAVKAAVVAIGKGDRQARLASLTLRHQGLTNDEERFPVVAVEEGSLLMENVLVSRASGHGVAVVNGGKASLIFCRVEESGWDGISAKGKGTRVSLKHVTAEGNLHHGVDFWNGAAGEVSESKFLTNGRAGLAAIGSADQLKVNGSLSEGNREIGFYFSAVTGAEVSECEARKNQLGGMIFERESKRVKIDQNRVTQNGKVGIVIEKGVELLSNSANVVEKNEGKQMWNDAVFTPRADEETISPPPPPAPPVPEDEVKGDKESKEGE